MDVSRDMARDMAIRFIDRAIAVETQPSQPPPHPHPKKKKKRKKKIVRFSPYAYAREIPRVGSYKVAKVPLVPPYRRCIYVSSYQDRRYATYRKTLLILRGTFVEWLTYRIMAHAVPAMLPTWTQWISFTRLVTDRDERFQLMNSFFP